MLELFAYPVSVVMKLWHLLVTGVFGVDQSSAWIIAIVGLVITVRGLLVPIAWIQKRSSHRAQLMRPEQRELEQRYGDSTDPDDLLAYQQAEKDLHEKYGYRPWVGCIPPLIQLPVILGLYRLLLWMSRPELLANHQNASGGVGVLSAEDVASFSEARIFDVPLPAYLSMSDARFAELGTTSADAWSVILPFIITAAIFTTLNMGVTLYFNYMYLDWSSALMRGLMRVMFAFLIVMPLFILLFGIFGPLPFALVLYWVMGNLWTAVQITLINIIVRRRWPEDDTHRELREQGRQELIDAREARRAQRREDRKSIAEADDRRAARADIKTRQEQEKQDEAQAKQRRKARQREVSQARGRLRAQQFKQARAEKAEQARLAQEAKQDEEKKKD